MGIKVCVRECAILFMRVCVCVCVCVFVRMNDCTSSSVEKTKSDKMFTYT